MAALLLALLVGASPAHARSLFWQSLDVDALLEEDGALRMTEEHAMVFDGDWNGGERRFRLGPGQRLELLALERIDPRTGSAHPLREGDLDEVDRYDWVGDDDEVLRWRSHLPSDPPFAGETKIYRLTYRLTGVLRPVVVDGALSEPRRYRLDHDFAFPDRVGTIQRYDLDLSVDPAFEAAPGAEALPETLTRESLRPGQGVVLATDLHYRGEGSPSAALPAPPPRLWVLVLSGIFLLAVAWELLRFIRSQSRLGRLWGELPQPAAVDRAWLEEEVFAHPPEVIGALWDRKVSSPEVSALLARLVVEGKIATEPLPPGSTKTDEPEMRLRLLVDDRNELDGTERALIDGLFFDGRREVTREEIKEHYKNEGFSPAGRIRPGLQSALDRIAPRRKTSSLWPVWATLFLLIAFFPLLIVETHGGGPGRLLALRTMVTLVLLGGAALGFAEMVRPKVDRLGRWLGILAVPLVLATLVLVGPVLLARFPTQLPTFGLRFEAPGWAGTLAALAVAYGLWRGLLMLAASRDSREAMALRQRLLQARRYLAGQLERPEPDLEDAWFPYLLAFGLTPAMDRWAESFGGRTDHDLVGVHPAVAGGGAGSSGSSFSSGGWSGGGSAFGGAGASASWGAAVAGFSAGVASPSSSGGGGRGGGASGGGGGGGW